MATREEFGIEFDKDEDNKAEYIPVNPEMKRVNIREAMKENWRLKQPHLIISVIGSEENFHLSQLLDDTIRRDLMNLSIRAGAWIVTNGSNSGVAKHVGKVVKSVTYVSKQHAVPVIGIVARNRDQNVEHLHDKNHSHFIVVHDANQRAKLEKELTKVTKTMNKNIPIIHLVLGGGSETLEAVSHILQNEMPIVVVEGSKGIACILAYAYTNAQEKTIQSISQDTKSTTRDMDDCVERTVREMIKREFKSDNIEEHMQTMKKCLERADLISVFELDSKTKLASSILQALLKANNNPVVDNLLMALAWDSLDVATSIIVAHGNSIKMDILEDFMFMAMDTQNVDFVKSFLNHGVSLKRFLTKERLLQLYNGIPKTCLVRSLLENIRNNKNNDPTKNSFDLKDLEKLIKDLMGDALDKESEWSVTDVNKPYNALFIWSILTVQQDMAKTFWVKGKDAIAKALVGYTLLTKLKSNLKGTEQEYANKIQKFINEWSANAVAVLNECHDTDEQRTKELLVRVMSNWGRTSCFLIAVNSQNKKFMSQKACQTVLNNIWNGRQSQDNSSLRLLCCMFCPILVIYGLKFREDTCSEVEQSQVSEKIGDSKSKPEQLKNKSEGKNIRSEQSNSESIPLRNLEISENMKTDGLKITSRQKLLFFFRAPVIICMYSMLSYIVFLSLYAFVLIFNFGSSVSPLDILLMVWVFSLTTDELRQVGSFSSSGLYPKLNLYISDGWNKLDILSIVLFIFGMTLRYLPYNDALEAARVVLAVNFISFCLRLLHIFPLHNKLGPKLVMIQRMLEDLMYFIVILMVFIVSYGIASHSILYPNSPLTLRTVVQVIRTAYWNFHGELFLDVIEGDAECTSDEMLWGNGTYPRCPSDVGKVVVPIMLAGYVLLTTVLLLNLLIAMFSFTVGKVQEETETISFFQRYSLIIEYSNRSVVCHPIVLLTHFFFLGRCIYAKLCKKRNVQSKNKFKQELKNEDYVKGLVRLENLAAETYHQTLEKEASAKVDFKVDRSSEILGRMVEQQRKLQSAHLEMKQQIQRIAETLEKVTSGEGFLRSTTE